MKLSLFKLFSFICASNGEDVLNPMYEAMTLIGPYALAIVLGLCIFYVIYLGVKYARSEDAKDKANSRKVILNFLIGFGIVVFLILVLYAIREPLATLIDG